MTRSDFRTSGNVVAVLLTLLFVVTATTWIARLDTHHTAKPAPFTAPSIPTACSSAAHRAFLDLLWLRRVSGDYAEGRTRAAMTAGSHVSAIGSDSALSACGVK